MHLDELLRLDNKVKKTFLIPENWSQGRTVFGGLSAALLFTDAQNKVSVDRLARSLHCNFIGPFFVEQEYFIKTDILREGKNVSVVQSSIVQKDTVCVQAQIVFGKKRKSKLSERNSDSHTMSLPRKATFIPQIPKMTPKALKHFELAIEQGKPFTGSKDSSVSGWMRLKEPATQMSIAHLIALIDSWPPTVLQQLRLPAPASTMTWTMNFFQPLPSLSPKAWFAYQAKTKDFSDGYGISDANIWDEQGQLLVSSNQIFTLFA